MACQDKDVLNNTLWALANIAGGAVEFRDHLLNSWIHKGLAQVANSSCIESFNDEICDNLAWLISNLCRDPLPKSEFILPLLPVLVPMLWSEADATLSRVCETMKRITMDDTVLEKLVELMGFDKTSETTTTQATRATDATRMNKTLIFRLISLAKTPQYGQTIASLRILGNFIAADYNPNPNPNPSPNSNRSLQVKPIESLLKLGLLDLVK